MTAFYRQQASARGAQIDTWTARKASTVDGKVLDCSATKQAPQNTLLYGGKEALQGKRSSFLPALIPKPSCATGEVQLLGVPIVTPK
jgi:hypothetical protein